MTTIWLAIKSAGSRQYAAWVEKDIELARILAAHIRRQPDFKIMGPNTLGFCNFRWEPITAGGSLRFSAEKNDNLNQALQEFVESEGDGWFSFTRLNGLVALRVNLENRNMEQSGIERLVQVIRRAADSILQKQ